MTNNMHTVVHVQSAILPLCESDFNVRTLKGCVAYLRVPQPLYALVCSFPAALLLCLVEVLSSASWTGGNLDRPSTCSGAPVLNDS